MTTSCPQTEHSEFAVDQARPILGSMAPVVLGSASRQKDDSPYPAHLTPGAWTCSGSDASLNGDFKDFFAFQSSADTAHHASRNTNPSPSPPSGSSLMDFAQDRLKLTDPSGIDSARSPGPVSLDLYDIVPDCPISEVAAMYAPIPPYSPDLEFGQQQLEMPSHGSSLDFPERQLNSKMADKELFKCPDLTDVFIALEQFVNSNAGHDMDQILHGNENFDVVKFFSQEHDNVRDNEKLNGTQPVPGPLAWRPLVSVSSSSFDGEVFHSLPE